MAQSIPKPELFARKASGIVRQGTSWRMFAFNFSYVGFLYVAMTYAFVPAFFPGADMVMGLIMVAIGSLPVVTVYAFYSAAMPRSGGDYVFVSRTLGPLLGYMVSFLEVVIYLFWIAWPSYLLSQTFLSGTFSVLASVTGNNPALTAIAGAFANREWSFVFATVIIICLALLTVTDMKVFYTFQTICVVVGLLGMGLVIALFLLTSNADFVARFNHWIEGVAGIKDGYQAIITKAEAAGYPANPPFSLRDTLGMVAVVWLVGVGTNFIGGEVKSAKKTQFIGMFGGSIAGALLILVIGIVIMNTVGAHFNGAANYLASVAPDQNPIPVAPWYSLWVSMTVDSSSFIYPVILGFVALNFIAWGLVNLPQNVIIPSRIFMAWSMDRVVPEKLCAIHPKYHTPYIAVIVSLIAAWLLLVFYVYTPWFLNLAPAFAYTFIFIIISIAGAVFPYLKHTRPIYKASGVSYEVFGIPVFTIAGVLGAIYWLISLYYAIVEPLLGMTSVGSILITGGGFGIGLIIYAIAYLYRRRQGISVERAFKELPPD